MNYLTNYVSCTFQKLKPKIKDNRFFNYKLNSSFFSLAYLEFTDNNARQECFYKIIRNKFYLFFVEIQVVVNIMGCYGSGNFCTKMKNVLVKF